MQSDNTEQGERHSQNCNGRLYMGPKYFIQAVLEYRPDLNRGQAYNSLKTRPTCTFHGGACGSGFKNKSKKLE